MVELSPRPGGTDLTLKTYHREKRRPRWQHCTFLPFLGVALLLFAKRPTEVATVPQGDAPARQPAPIPVLTLSFENVNHAKFIENNCVFASNAGYRYIVYTDSPHLRYCQGCECVLFKKVDCPCPHPTAKKCTACEKLRFLVDRLAEFDEFIFLDADLVILKPYFLDRLSIRSKESDFLATYVQLNRNMSYFENFNSGLFFIRRLPGLDFEDLYRHMYNNNLSHDQTTITSFIQAKYDSWDSLSLKWHCRHLLSQAYDIEPRLCYTFHDKYEWREVFPRINFTLKALP